MAGEQLLCEEATEEANVSAEECLWSEIGMVLCLVLGTWIGSKTQLSYSLSYFNSRAPIGNCFVSFALALFVKVKKMCCKSYTGGRVMW